MPQQTRSAEESEAIRSSHAELLNQLIKVESGFDPFSTLSRYSSSIDSNCMRVELSADIVRNLFNHLRLTDIAREQSYQVWIKSRSKTVVMGKSNISPEARSTMLVFRAVGGEASFHVHAFINDRLEIEGDHRMLDPKNVKFAGRVEVAPIPPQSTFDEYL